MGVSFDDPTKMPTARSPGWRLVVFWEGGSEAIDLRPNARLVLGRADDSDVCIPHESVSRRHALLTGSGGTWRIEDIGSSNGTFVAGVRLPKGEPQSVTPGTVVMLGDARFVLDGAGAGAGATVAAGINAGTTPSQDEGMQVVQRLVSLVADSMLSVLLLGETGVGKGRLAEEIHRRSSRASGPFVRLNCAAVPEPLLESELFGHERGAFTGAIRAKTGILETASGGTAFLDEVGEMPGSTQAKFLHVLEHNEVQRIGGLEPRPIDVRFIAATNQEVVAGGGFRRDLYFRLAGVPLRIPPLRERPAEIPAMVRTFIAEACAQSRRPCPEISDEAMARLAAYAWPGNVRELRNVVARAALVCGSPIVLPEHLIFDTAALDPPSQPRSSPSGMAADLDRPPRPGMPTSIPTAQRSEPTEAAPEGGRLEVDLREYERARIVEALELFGGHQGKAAAHLGVSRRTLTNKLNGLRLPRPRKRDGG
jgi:DNA-binding NtrC family response regulator